MPYPGLKTLSFLCLLGRGSVGGGLIGGRSLGGGLLGCGLVSGRSVGGGLLGYRLVSGRGLGGGLLGHRLLDGRSHCVDYRRVGRNGKRAVGCVLVSESAAN